MKGLHTLYAYSIQFKFNSLNNIYVKDVLHEVFMKKKDFVFC